MSLGRVSITFIAAYKYSYNQQYAKNGGFLQKKFGDDVIFLRIELYLIIQLPWL